MISSFISMFSIRSLIEDQWVVSACSSLLHNLLLFFSLPLISSVLVFLSKKIYLELSPQESSIYFSSHSLLILIWNSSVDLIFSTFLIKTAASEAESPKLGRNSLSLFFFMFWMNLSASSYLCFLVIVRTLFLHFVEMNLIELALHLSCRCFHVWNRWRWGGDQIVFFLKVFFNIVAQSDDDSNAWYGNQCDNFVFRKYSAVMYPFHCFSSMHCLFEEYMDGFLWKNFSLFLQSGKNVA